MENRTESIRQCPTRADGADPLIAHGIAPATCQERQRRHYHKCYSCAHRNAPSVNGRPGPKLSSVLEKVARADRAAAAL